MFDPKIPDLTLQRMPIGTHSATWDLRVFLYLGGAEINRRKGFGVIERGGLGRPLLERLPFMSKIHEIIDAMLELGSAVSTVESHLENLSLFVGWVDAQQTTTLTLMTVRDLFRAWVEHLIYRYQVKKEIKHTSAYGSASRVAALVGRALDCTNSEPARLLMRCTRMRRPGRHRSVLGTQADKQKLSDTFEFGHLMAGLCEGLNLDALRGPLPITITIQDTREIVLKGMLKNLDMVPESLRSTRDRERAMRFRAPLAASESAIDVRPSLINVRVEAELLIFVAQTSMNLSQAAHLRREHYRWQTDGDELNAFRVYKGRRGGEAIFRCFKAYRDHLQRYFKWLDDVGLSDVDERFFPFVHHTGKIPAEHSSPQFQATKLLCKIAGVKHIGPRSLRRTRVNWLLRRSRDPNQTAEQVAHTKETLLTVYEEPHYQSAVAEIVNFHQATDPTLVPPGPGVCVHADGRPEVIKGAPPEAPTPDCISPEGCLFCVYHRDVMSAEYCWKLASHARLKSLETVFYRPPKRQFALPAHAVIDCIESKLLAIAGGSDIRASWVCDARDAIRSGTYHPLWDGHILLLETLNDS
jgi:integrase